MKFFKKNTRKITLFAIVILLIFGFWKYQNKDRFLTSSECADRGGKIVNTLNYLIDGPELEEVPGAYEQIVDPEILEKSIGEVKGLECPCICVVE